MASDRSPCFILAASIACSEWSFQNISCVMTHWNPIKISLRTQNTNPESWPWPTGLSWQLFTVPVPLWLVPCYLLVVTPHSTPVSPATLPCLSPDTPARGGLVLMSPYQRLPWPPHPAHSLTSYHSLFCSARITIWQLYLFGCLLSVSPTGTQAPRGRQLVSFNQHCVPRTVPGT